MPQFWQLKPYSTKIISTKYNKESIQKITHVVELYIYQLKEFRNSLSKATKTKQNMSNQVHKYIPFDFHFVIKIFFHELVICGFQIGNGDF